jgi:hypothetical protein
MSETGTNSAADAEYVVVAHFLDSAEAAGAVAALQGAGLSPRLRDVYTVGMNWLYGPALGGIRLEVPAAQQLAAIELLEHESSSAEPLPSDDAAYFVAARSERRTRGAWGIAFLLLPGLAALGLLMAIIGPPWKDRRDVG